MTPQLFVTRVYNEFPKHATISRTESPLNVHNKYMKTQRKITLPAEWSFQDAILLCWPHKNMDWLPILQEVEKAFDEMSYHICLHQTLVIIAHDKAHQKEILQRLSNNSSNTDNIRFLIHTNNDSWCRDFGPICIVKDNTPIALNFEFNGWGEKYPFQFDNATNQKLKADQILSCELESIPFVLEGGSIDSDGEGTLLTTSQCLLSNKRNPLFNQQDIEQELATQLGTKRILWLKNGQLDGDDTDSHIDNLARFCNTDTIVYAYCDENDSHFQSLHAMKLELEKFKTLSGTPYHLIPLKIPQALFDDGQRLAASYVNFLITNKLVLMPTYNDKQDDINITQLQSVFTDRKVIGIDCSSIIKQSGSIHCLTMQLPMGTVTQAHTLSMRPAL